MAAVAHASPADVRRLSLVGTVVRPVPARVPTTVYRRRRAAALLVLVAAVLAVALAVQGLLAAFGGGPLTASERPGSAPAGGVYVVQPGDTFWEIARRLAPGEDPRPLVADLVAAHGGATLVSGERLRLPDRF